MKHPMGYLKNTTTGRFHPISFREAPMPYGVGKRNVAQRYRSIGHHTEGFDTIKAARKWVSEQEHTVDVNRIWEWDGKDVPAMVEWFAVT